MRADLCLNRSAPSVRLLKFLKSQQNRVNFSSQSCPTPPAPLRARTSRSCSDARLEQTLRQFSTGRTSHNPCLSDPLPRLYKPTEITLPLATSTLRPTAPSPRTSRLSRETSTAPPSHLKRLLARWRQDAPGDKPSNLPPGQSFEDPSGQLFNLSRSVARSTAGADSKLRCTEFDSHGSVTMVSEEFKKSELIAKYGLLPRDLRKIDSSVLPHILVRQSAILINLLHLRVLIQSDRVLVFDAYGSTDTYTQSVFMYDLEGKLRQKSDVRSNGSSTYLPYELRALEAVLISVTSGLETEFEGVREPVVRVLRELEEDIDREKLRHLLIHSKKLGTFEQKARLVRDAINDLLDADDDLAAMYLTEKRITGKPRSENDHQEVEMLLESYHKICDEIVEISGNLIGNIRNTEEVVKAILDANRNSLMLLDLKFSIGTLGLATGTLAAGLYGMNLKNFMEESDLAFSGVTITCIGLTAIVALYGMKRLRRVQRVRMWGEGYASDPGSARGNWRTEAFDHAGLGALPGESRTERLQRHQQGRGPVLWPGMEGLRANTCGSDVVDPIHNEHTKLQGETRQMEVIPNQAPNPPKSDDVKKP